MASFIKPLRAGTGEWNNGLMGLEIEGGKGKSACPWAGWGKESTTVAHLKGKQTCPCHPARDFVARASQLLQTSHLLKSCEFALATPGLDDRLEDKR